MKNEEPVVKFENSRYGDTDPTKVKWAFCCLQHYSGITHCFLADGIKSVDKRKVYNGRRD